MAMTNEQLKQIYELPGCKELLDTWKQISPEELVTLATQAFTTGNKEMQELVCMVVGFLVALERAERRLKMYNDAAARVALDMVMGELG